MLINEIEAIFKSLDKNENGKIPSKQLTKFFPNKNLKDVSFKEFKDLILLEEKELLKFFNEMENVENFDHYFSREVLEKMKLNFGIETSNKEIELNLKTENKRNNLSKLNLINFLIKKKFDTQLPYESEINKNENNFKMTNLKKSESENKVKSIFKSILALDFAFDFDSLFNGDSQGIFLLSDETISRLKYFFAGGISGLVSRTATAPLDRIRVLLQTSTKTKTTNKASISYAINAIYQSGGIKSFYKGNGINVLKVFPESAIKFMVFENCKSFIIKNNNIGQEDGQIGILGRLIAGGTAGLISQFSIYPLETLKIRLMTMDINQNIKIPVVENTVPNTMGTINSKVSTANLNFSSNNFNNQKFQSVVSNGTLNTIKSIYNEGGVKTFYRGCTPSLVGIIPYAAIDLTVFETLKNAYSDYYQEKPQIPMILISGMISGTIGATIMYPVSVIRTRMQAMGTKSHPEHYEGVIDCVTKTFKKERIGGFYKGLLPTLMKVVPSVSISYAVYDSMKKILNAD
ncbi:hypothetical protein HDU92_005360 [Lobulomyces angularis]|nr:hypothetical protein HDU92_005360 [Lobulomyces angularis]